MRSVLLVFALLVFLTIDLQAQLADRPTIAAGGNYVSYSADLNFQTTVGEVATQTIQSASLMLTQGFQQTEQIIDIPNGGSPSDLLIYPNPAAEAVKIRLNLNVPAWINFALINNAGQLVHQSEQQVAAGIQEIPFNFRVAPGIYLLTLRFDGKIISSKVIVQ
ncbi:MAG: T9SS type A sorting domain-containing protein [Sphingobacteriaceae bacterium]